jgi:hypothetical protein
MVKVGDVEAFVREKGVARERGEGGEGRESLFLIIRRRKRRDSGVWRR